VGAPLTPYVHWLLFRDRDRSRAIHNLGGISNLTYLPRGADFGKILAFDTGPANVLMDTYLRLLTKGAIQMDRNGDRAARGQVLKSLLSSLLRHPFLRKSPPKSTGREEFGRKIVSSLVEESRTGKLRAEDVLATLSAFTARAIGNAYRRFVLPTGELDEIVLTGGGRKNKTLLRMIKRELPSVPIRLVDELGMDGDALEAIAFGILAHLAVAGQAVSLRPITGAKRAGTLGKIIPGKNFRRVSLGRL
jgi:anhydro-N-acetylmuramic acid kinase